jgi:hypothetical protein
MSRSAGRGHRGRPCHGPTTRSRGWIVAVCGVLACVATHAPSTSFAFSFSEEEERDEASRREVGRRSWRGGSGSTLGADCRARLGQRRTVVLIAERSDDGGYRTEQSTYGPHLQALTRRLRELGVRTYSPEEIRAQVAQEEIDAYFRNDPDAALAASAKLGADLFLRGVISSRSTFNEFMGLPEVAISMGIALADRSGAVVSEATASADSYSGADTLGMALKLTNEQAPSVVTQLFADYCRLDRAGGG